MSIDKLILNNKILVCVGSGGVGKTTVAAGIGIRAAQLGKKVLILTIDPSKRLADTLGISGKKEITRVPEQKYAGEIYASIVDHKKIFDDFVKRAALTSAAAEKIFSNKLYIQLSTTMSGSQEFTALQMLYSAYESQRYDLIVLDTPPAKHAIDFINAPQKLAHLFNENISRWFRAPDRKESGFISHLFHAGTKKVIRLLETITGSDFIAQLADFFSHIKDWQQKLEQRIIDTHRLLVSDSTQFVLITSSDEAKTIEAEYLLREIRKSGHHISAIIFNRVFPEWLEPNTAMNQNLIEIYSQMKTYYDEKNRISLRFENQHAHQVEIFKIPDTQNDVSNLKGLEAICKYLIKNPHI